MPDNEYIISFFGVEEQNKQRNYKILDFPSNYTFHVHLCVITHNKINNMKNIYKL